MLDKTSLSTKQKIIRSSGKDSLLLWLTVKRPQHPLCCFFYFTAECAERHRVLLVPELTHYPDTGTVQRVWGIKLWMGGKPEPLTMHPHTPRSHDLVISIYLYIYIYMFYVYENRVGIAFTSTQKCSLFVIFTTTIASIIFFKCTNVYIHIKCAFISFHTDCSLRLKRRRARGQRRIGAQKDWA